MRARKIYETIDFERGMDPKSSMGIGMFRDKRGIPIRIGSDVMGVTEDGFYFSGIVKEFTKDGTILVKDDLLEDPVEAKPLEIEVLTESVNFERGQDPKTAMDLGRFRDKNGRLIQKGDSVFADPESEDTFYEFQGTVDSFRGEYVTVRDMEDEYFDIEPYKLEILDESVSFERGMDPKSSMGIGLAARKIEAYEELEQAINEEFPSFLEDNIVDINDWEPGRSPFKYIRKSILVRGPMLHGESAKKVLNRWMKKYFPDFRVTSLRDFGYIKGRIYYMKISWKYDNLDESVSFERGQNPRASIGIGLFDIFVNNLQKMKESGIHKIGRASCRERV